jgi:secreted trypsin-like serine protease
VTSFGQPPFCIDDAKPGVYARISNQMKWIRSIAGEEIDKCTAKTDHADSDEHNHHFNLYD